MKYHFPTTIIKDSRVLDLIDLKRVSQKKIKKTESSDQNENRFDNDLKNVTNSELTKVRRFSNEEKKSMKNKLESKNQSETPTFNENFKFFKFVDTEKQFPKIINPKLKEKSSFLEKFIEKHLKSLEVEDEKIIENLPFKKKKYRRSFSVKNKKSKEEEVGLKVPNYNYTIYEKKLNKNLTLIEAVNKKIDLNEAQNLNSLDNHENEKMNKSIKTRKDSSIDDNNHLHKFGNVYDSFSNEEILYNVYNGFISFIINEKFRHSLDCVMIFLIIYSSFITFYGLSNEKSSNFFIFVEIILEALFFVDLLSNLFTPFHNDNDFLIQDMGLIIKQYIKSPWFFIDLVSCFPFTLIQYFLVKNNHESIKFPQSIYSLYSRYFIGNWLKSFRIFKVLKYSFISDIQILQNSKLNRVLKSSIMFIILVFFSSCFWVYIGSIGFSSNNWINHYMVDAGETDIFIASLYFNLVTVYTIGYGDITPTNNIEIIYCLFLLIFGVMLFSFAVSSLSSLFSINDNKTAIFQAKISMLDSIKSDYKINNSLYNLIRKYIVIEFERNKNDRYELIDSLPSKIKNQLSFYMYKVLVKELEFFKDQPSDFVLFVLPFLKSHLLQKNEIIFSEGEFVNETYIVTKGSLSLCLGDIYENLEIGVIRENTHFGDLLMYLNEQSPFEVKCKSSTCEVFVLKSVDFLKIKSSFNQNIIKILKDSYEILESIDRRRRQFINLYHYEKSVDGIRKILKKINVYLMKKGFDSYFNDDVEFENAYDFLINNDFQKILKIIEFEDVRKMTIKSRKSIINQNLTDSPSEFKEENKPPKNTYNIQDEYEKKYKSISTFLSKVAVQSIPQEEHLRSLQDENSDFQNLKHTIESNKNLFQKDEITESVSKIKSNEKKSMSDLKIISVNTKIKKSLFNINEPDILRNLNKSSKTNLLISNMENDIMKEKSFDHSNSRILNGKENDNLNSFKNNEESLFQYHYNYSFCDDSKKKKSSKRFVTDIGKNIDDSPIKKSSRSNLSQAKEVKASTSKKRRSIMMKKSKTILKEIQREILEGNNIDLIRQESELKQKTLSLLNPKKSKEIRNTKKKSDDYYKNHVKDRNYSLKVGNGESYLRHNNLNSFNKKNDSKNEINNNLKIQRIHEIFIMKSKSAKIEFQTQVSSVFSVYGRIGKRIIPGKNLVRNNSEKPPEFHRKLAVEKVLATKREFSTNKNNFSKMYFNKENYLSPLKNTPGEIKTRGFGSQKKRTSRIQQFKFLSNLTNLTNHQKKIYKFWSLLQELKGKF